MEKKLTSKLNIQTGSEASKKKENFQKNNAKSSEKLRIQISKLSYEDALMKLDILLEKLKTESLLVEELKESFLEGNLYIEHCESLLNKVEQEVLEISQDDL